MLRGSFSFARRVTGAGAFLLAVGLAPCVWMGGARAEDGLATVTLDDFTQTSKDGDLITIKHAVFEDANLSKDEIVKLLTLDTPAADQLALARKLKAASISIPLVDIDKKEGGAIHIHDISATDVDAGKIAKLGFSSIEGAGTGDDGPVSVKSGAFRLEDADLSGPLGAPNDAAALAPTVRLGRLSWTGLDVVAPDKDAAGQRGSIHFGFASLENRNDYEGDAFKDSMASLKGLTIAPSKGTDFANSLGALGYSSLDLSAAAAVRYDEAGKKLSVDELTIDYARAGSIGVKASFGSVAPALFGNDKGARIAAAADGEISSLEIKLVNAGLFEKVVAYYAQQQNTTPEAVKAQWSDAAGQMLPLMLGGEPAALKVASETQKFIASPKNLTIALRPKGEPVKLIDFLGLANPQALLAKIDIDASANK